ncbi:MAG: hypothetical protein HXY26_03970 [Hydrogenophilaceae bacterium]|nr:hypothetical protein [Hydrogenophilaceae bacterium]
MVEAQLRRLTWLIAVASLIGFGSAAAWSYFQERSMQQAVSGWHELMNRSISECEKNRESVYCEGIEHIKSEFESAAQSRDHYSNRLEQYSVAALALPLLSAAIFLALRWVITGQAPQWPIRKK